MSLLSSGIFPPDALGFDGLSSKRSERPVFVPED